MDAVIDKAMALPNVTGAMIMGADWLVILSRGDLTAKDAAELQRLLCWTELDSTGSIAWREDDLHAACASCIHFHRAAAHTLVLHKLKSSKALHCSARSHPRAAIDRLSPPNSSLEAIKAAVRPRSWY